MSRIDDFLEHTGKRIDAVTENLDSLIGKLQACAEAAEAEAVGLRTRCQGLAKECAALEDDREYNATIVVERDEELISLRQQLAAVTELVPPDGLLQWLAETVYENIRTWPKGPFYDRAMEILKETKELAADIRAWRGAGDGGEKQEEEDKS